MNETAKLFRGILIDPIEKSVSEVQTEAGLHELYDLLDCRVVEATPLGNGEMLWIDEEGLFAEPPKPFFSFLGREQHPLCGKGLILNTDGEGGHADCQLPLDLVKRRIVFRNIEFDTITTRETTDERGFVIEQKAYFKPKET